MRPVAVRTSVLAILALVGAAQAGVYSYRTIALTGTDGIFGPGLGAGVAFSSLTSVGTGGGSQTINGANNVIFTGALNAGASGGVWIRNGVSANHNLIQNGQAAPSGGTLANSFVFPMLNNAGQWVYRENTGTTGRIYGDFGSGLATVARVGDQAPGAPAGCNYSNIGTPSPNFNQAGAVSFPASLTGTGVVISGTGANSGAIFIGGAGSMHMALRQNDATGLTDVAIGSITTTSLPLVVNDSSRYGVIVGLQGAAVVTSGATANNQAFISDRSGSMAIIARKADPAAGVSDGALYNALSVPAMNNAGRVAFVSTLKNAAGTSVGTALFSDNTGVLGVTARSATPTPAIAGLPADAAWGTTFSNVVINGSGTMAYSGGGLTGTGLTSANNSGIFLCSPSGAITMVEQTGAHAAGTTGDCNYGSLQGSIALNGAGEIAFTTLLSGVDAAADPSVGNPQIALFATDEYGVISLIARKGTWFDVGDGGPLRQISNIGRPGGTGGQDSKPIGFNDHGQLVYSLDFTDGSSGVFVATVPAPAGVATLALTGLLALPRRRRN